MTRVKRGVMVRKKRKKLFLQTKGFKHGRKKLVRQAHQAILRAKTHEYRDRRTKKRNFRRIWIVKINAFCRLHGMTYSIFIKKLKDNKIELDRKILADLAQNNEEELEKIIAKVK